MPLTPDQEKENLVARDELDEMVLTPDQELNIPDELKAEEELIAADLVIFNKEKENLVALLKKRDELDEQKNDIENAIHENEIAVEASQTTFNDINH